jgi:hypothetical protein
MVSRTAPLQGRAGTIFVDPSGAARNKPVVEPGAFHAFGILEGALACVV